MERTTNPVTQSSTSDNNNEETYRSNLDSPGPLLGIFHNHHP